MVVEAIETDGDLVASLRAELARERERRLVAEGDVATANHFAAMLGHDLRNPLNTVAMGATMMARAGAGEIVTRAAHRISASADRMARMIDQLLELTAMRAAGGLALARGRVDAAELCRRVVGELELGPLRAPIAMSTSGHTFGMWDAPRLQRVFENIVGNAVAHGARDGQIEVDIDGVQGARVIVTVRNDGAIDAAGMPGLFEAVRGRGHAKATANGLGLGLHISRMIVDAHGGTIEVASDAAKGTRVSVELPRLPGHAPD